MTGSGRLSLPKFANRSSARAKRFSLELNSWSTASSSTRMVRVRRCERNISEKVGSSWRTRMIAAFSNRMISQSVIAVAVDIRSVCPVIEYDEREIDDPDGVGLPNDAAAIDMREELSTI